MIKIGDLVLAHGQNGVFIVRTFSEHPDMAEIQLFSVSTTFNGSNWNLIFIVMKDVSNIRPKFLEHVPPYAGQ